METHLLLTHQTHRGSYFRMNLYLTLLTSYTISYSQNKHAILDFSTQIQLRFLYQLIPFLRWTFSSEKCFFFRKCGYFYSYWLAIWISLGCALSKLHIVQCLNDTFQLKSKSITIFFFCFVYMLRNLCQMKPVVWRELISNVSFQGRLELQSCKMKNGNEISIAFGNLWMCVCAIRISVGKSVFRINVVKWVVQVDNMWWKSKRQWLVEHKSERYKYQSIDLKWNEMRMIWSFWCFASPETSNLNGAKKNWQIAGLSICLSNGIYLHRLPTEPNWVSKTKQNNAIGCMHVPGSWTKFYGNASKQAEQTMCICAKT